jgi:hypothetical protein
MFVLSLLRYLLANHHQQHTLCGCLEGLEVSGELVLLLLLLLLSFFATCRAYGIWSKSTGLHKPPFSAWMHMYSTVWPGPASKHVHNNFP